MFFGGEFAFSPQRVLLPVALQRRSIAPDGGATRGRTTKAVVDRKAFVGWYGVGRKRRVFSHDLEFILKLGDVIVGEDGNADGLRMRSVVSGYFAQWNHFATMSADQGEEFGVELDSIRAEQFNGFELLRT